MRINIAEFEKKWIAPYRDDLAKTWPKAFCTGTILPCTAGDRCRHFGAHRCSTFKKHTDYSCPHYRPDHDFRCIRLKGTNHVKEEKLSKKNKPSSRG